VEGVKRGGSDGSIYPEFFWERPLGGEWNTSQTESLIVSQKEKKRHYEEKENIKKEKNCKKVYCKRKEAHPFQSDRRTAIRTPPRKRKKDEMNTDSEGKEVV